MKKIKKKINFFTIFVGGSILILLIFAVYFCCNVFPRKERISINNIANDDAIINYKIENVSARISIFFSTNSSIFKAYDYHSYISGDGHGEKIFLRTYLISEDKTICYRIKSLCYDYSDSENLKFIASFYNDFIDTNKKYKLAIYIVEKDIWYLTDIEI